MHACLWVGISKRVHVPTEARNMRSLGAGAQCECWEPSSGPLGEQSALFTAEPSLQPHCEEGC